MSSAILYFAIVAIWAGILMPRWLRPSARRHHAEETQPEAAAPEALATFAQAGLETEDAEPVADVEPAEQAEQAAAWAETAAARRANVLRARRRMLTTLVVLTLGAIGIAVSHIAAWWVTVPPGLLLAGFLLLLREAARSDAARARRLAHDRSRQAEPRQRRRPADREEEPEVFERITSTPEAPLPEPVPEPDAEIIDISARVNDQVYDQYTDAAERAVGD